MATPSTTTSDLDADPFGLAQRAASQLAERSGTDRHDLAIVLGSGWQAAADLIGDTVAEIPVTELVGFPPPSVAGHTGAIRSVIPHGDPERRVLVFLGRVHLYEGRSPATVVHGIRTAVLAGCRAVILTNAAGAINPSYAVGDPVLVADHVNLTGRSPLTGPIPPPPFEGRFVDMSDAYSPRLRRAAHQVEPALAEGVYVALPGPQFETPAEIRLLARLGGDLVGMSTVLEAIAARHLGAEVLACSLVTNPAAGLAAETIDHRAVLDVAEQSAPRLGDLLAALAAEV